jgi:tRNA(Ile)-lysidine synthase
LLAELAAAAGVPAASGRVLVAHTADDRAETFLMRALFGGGLGALTGMRACRGVVVRPLLGETRATLRAYLAEQGVGWREDATNADEEALRSYVRRRVVPPLVARNPRFAHTLGSALDLLSDEDDLLGRMADELLERALRAREPGAVELDAAVLAAAERPLARRAVRAALELAWGPDGFERARPNAAHVETVLDLVAAGGGSATLPLGLDARVGAGVLSLALPSTSLDADAALRPGESLAWGGWELACWEHRLERPGSAFERARAIAGERAASGLREGRDFVLVDVAVAGAGGELWVGAPRSGERMRPFGMEGSKLLSDVVREAGVARHARGRVPVVRGADGNVVWVGGFRLDARAAYGGATRVLLELSAWPAAAPQPGSGA